jgi:hypothetical protein
LTQHRDAPFYLYRDAVRHMLEAGHGGSLIGMSSLASIRSVGPAPHYSAAKAGLNQLSTVLAEQLGPHGIRINTIVPGFVKSNTPTNIAVRSDPKLYEGMMKRVPMRRMGEPADVAALAVFLASDLSSFITGQSIVIDGGQSTRMVIDPPAGVGSSDRPTVGCVGREARSVCARRAPPVPSDCSRRDEPMAAPPGGDHRSPVERSAGLCWTPIVARPPST